MDKKDRLNEIIRHYCDGKPSVFAKFLGVAPSTISSWLSRDTFDYDLIFAKCENISSEWLLTGRGEMIKQEANTYIPQTKPVSVPSTQASPDIVSTLLATIQEQLSTIQKQAEEIGRLKECLRQADMVKGKNVSDALTEDIANAG